MSWRVRTTIFITCLAILMSCSEDEQNVMLMNGSYQGVFTVTYADQTLTGETVVSLQSGQYSCVGNQNKIPSGGSGTYDITGDMISFNDGNYWTAEFDWGLILAGKYTYSLDGENLTLIKQSEIASYQYQLALN